MELCLSSEHLEFLPVVIDILFYNLAIEAFQRIQVIGISLKDRK